MSLKVQLKHSAVKDKAPVAADLTNGELALNINDQSPAAYIKDSAGNIVKIAGKGAIGGTPATETAAGIVELATAAETTAGTDATKAVHPAGLKVELDKKAPLNSPALTGVPTAPTAAAGTNNTQLATTAFVTAAVGAEDLWDRTGTAVSPTTTGDTVQISAGTAALPGLTPVGDPNTGVWAPAADAVAVSTNGSERLRVTSDGKLGLRTDSPKCPLHVLGPDGAGGNPTLSSNNIALFQNDGGTTDGAVISVVAGNAATAQISLGDVDNANIGAIKYNNSNDSLDFVVNTNPRATIDTSGRLGIGVTAPLGILHARPADECNFVVRNDGASVALSAETNSGRNDNRLMRLEGNEFVFIENGSEKARIDSLGRLLIGTSNPVSGSAATLQCANIANIAGVSVYADNTAAKAGGLVPGDVYRKADGTLMITF